MPALLLLILLPLLGSIAIVFAPNRQAKWIALGVSLGVLVGVASGVYPAAQASKLAPVDALRHE